MDENTSTRLKQIMSDRCLKQVDILQLARPYCEKYNMKLGKSDLSQFISGKVEPGQWKLTILGLALNVSEAWLMGYDVNMAREMPPKDSSEELSDNEIQLIENYRSLNEEGQEKLLDISDDLVQTGKYKKRSASCMGREA